MVGMVVDSEEGVGIALGVVAQVLMLVLAGSIGVATDLSSETRCEVLYRV